MNTSSFMDKQIMDLSSSSSVGVGGKEFIDFNDKKKEEILASYDFIGGGDSRAWNSIDSKPNTITGFRHYGSMDSLEPEKVISEKERIPGAEILSEIEQTMKKYTDKLLHALEGISARLSQLETKTRHLENSVDDLKVSVGNNYGSTDGKMRQLENILREVQTGVQDLRGKHDIVEAHLELVKLQPLPKVDQHAETQNTSGHSNALHQAASAPLQQSAFAPQQSYQQHPPPVAPPPSVPTLPSPNAPPPPPPPQLQSFPPQVQYPNQFSQNQIPPAAQRDPYLPSLSQLQDSTNQQYQLPQTQQSHAPTSSVPHQQFQQAPPPQYTQPPQPPQQHPSLPPVNPPPPHIQPPTSHRPEETPYAPSQIYPPGLYQPHSYPPGSAPPPSQQFYGPPSHMYESLGRSSSGFSSGYGPPTGSSEPFPYSGSPRHGEGSTMKTQQLPSSTMSQGGGSGYPQLPSARVLPHALPTASAVSGGSGSGGSGNRLPVDDVIDKVTGMGFPREQVRATVRRLTENGQSVDWNVVLDKLMNA